MEDLHEWFSFNNETGEISRIKSKWGSKLGVLTTTNGAGYIVVKHNQKMYYGHHLAWFFGYGEMPKFIDHINGIRTDNRISNLRLSSFKDNSKNLKLDKRNISGVRGITWNKQHQKWKVMLGSKYLGWFSDIEEAKLCRKSAESGTDYSKFERKK